MVLPILMAITLGTIDLGRMVVAKETAHYAAVVGARTALGRVNSSGTTLSSTDVQNAVIAAAPMLKLTTSNVSVTVSGSTTAFASRARGDTVTVAVTNCTFTPLIPKISKIISTGKSCNTKSAMVVP